MNVILRRGRRNDRNYFVSSRLTWDTLRPCSKTNKQTLGDTRLQPFHQGRPASSEEDTALLRLGIYKLQWQGAE